MRVLAVIPSRYESSRFPGKPLIDLAGKSMIQRVYEGVSKSNLISKIVVATDDQRIVDEVISFKGQVMMTSPEHVNGTGRCVEVCQQLENYDLVINVQGDEPLIQPTQLDILIHAFEDPDVEIATLAMPNISSDDIANPNRIKVVLDCNNDALYFSRSPIPNTEKTSESVSSFKHIGIYAFRRNALLETQKMKACSLEISESLEQLRWIYFGKKIRVVETTIETPNIDSPADVEKVLRLM